MHSNPKSSIHRSYPGGTVFRGKYYRVTGTKESILIDGKRYSWFDMYGRKDVATRMVTALKRYGLVAIIRKHNDMYHIYTRKYTAAIPEKKFTIRRKR